MKWALRGLFFSSGPLLHLRAHASPCVGDQGSARHHRAGPEREQRGETEPRVLSRPFPLAQVDALSARARARIYLAQLVEGAPKVIKKDVAKDDADALKEKLGGVGAVVDLE